MEKRPTKRTDFRILALPLQLLPYFMMLMLFVFKKQTSQFISTSFGPLGLLLFVGVIILLFRYCQLPYYLLVKIFYKDLLTHIREYIVVEIEDAKSYDKFKFMPDDIGVIFCKNKLILMKTNSAIYEISAELFTSSIVSVKSNDKLKALKIHLAKTNEALVIKPIYSGWNFNLQGNPQKKIDWMLKLINMWAKT
jgi:hypothetical protein